MSEDKAVQAKSTFLSQPKQLTRENYKTIKKMDREQMSAYVCRVFSRGYEAGLKAAKQKLVVQEHQKQEDSNAGEK